MDDAERQAMAQALQNKPRALGDTFRYYAGPHLSESAENIAKALKGGLEWFSPAGDIKGAVESSQGTMDALKRRDYANALTNTGIMGASLASLFLPGPTAKSVFSKADDAGKAVTRIRPAEEIPGIAERLKAKMEQILGVPVILDKSDTAAGRSYYLRPDIDPDELYKKFGDYRHRVIRISDHGANPVYRPHKIERQITAPFDDIDNSLTKALEIYDPAIMAQRQNEALSAALEKSGAVKAEKLRMAQEAYAASLGKDPKGAAEALRKAREITGDFKP